MAVLKGDLVWLPYTCHIVSVTGFSEDGLSVGVQPVSCDSTQIAANINVKVLFIIKSPPNILPQYPPF